MAVFPAGLELASRQPRHAAESWQMRHAVAAVTMPAEMPFHHAVHDSTGASLVIEFHHGMRTLYDNPVGVTTNAPQFSWHLTNLDNYTFLGNVDRSKATFGAYQAVQPGAGISKAGLPGSDTSVDRFIRAVFYTQFAEKQTDPGQAAGDLKRQLAAGGFTPDTAAAVIDPVRRQPDAPLYRGLRTCGRPPILG